MGLNNKDAEDEFNSKTKIRASYRILYNKGEVFQNTFGADDDAIKNLTAQAEYDNYHWYVYYSDSTGTTSISRIIGLNEEDAKTKYNRLSAGL